MLMSDISHSRTLALKFVTFEALELRFPTTVLRHIGVPQVVFQVSHMGLKTWAIGKCEQPAV